MSNGNQNTNAENPVRVRRGRVASVDLYEVKESELEVLENGNPTSIYLNFAIFLLSIAFSSIVCLANATFSSNILQNSFLFISILGILVGLLLLILWWNGRTSRQTIINRIKGRIPPEYIEQEQPEIQEAEEELDEEEAIEPEG